MPEVQKGQEQLVFLTFILYRYNLSFYYNQVQFVPVFIIEKSALNTEKVFNQHFDTDIDQNAAAQDSRFVF